MSKDDVPPLPDRVPAKRRAVEQLLDVHIAQWIASDTITPSERRRLSEERERRKRSQPDRRVGLLVGPEGVTPEQLAALSERLRAAHATELRHAGVSRSLHAACRALGVPVIADRNEHIDRDERMRDIVRSCDVVFAAPRDTTEPIHKTGVWELVRYARHRGVPVHVVTPDGNVRGSE